MQPAFAVGTVLRDRYVIQSILGQGGMGRTYKAIDKERFDEPCVLKEFMPPNDSPTVVAKARELFQREASTLYQISHPQVPQFRAAFEMSGRLFLVQDYVEGKNFRDLLQEHGAFDEGSILQLLLEVLPILSYLHSRGIIHRDISPENLMLRAKDNLPVLIDFGVVQAAQMGLPPSTIAGKPGYAPPEQLQSGNAYASSDLYALAVTAVVLLTDREPSELFDHRSLTWEWHEYAQVSPNFRQILDKMLAYKPAHRYSSADEVLGALKLLEASRSQVRTYAVNVQPLSTNLGNASGDRTVEVQHTIYADIQGKPTRKPWIWRFNWLWAILLVILSGIGSWAITSILFDQGRRITPEPTPTPILSTPTPTATIIPNINRNLELVATDREGQQRATATGKIQAEQSITFRLNLEKGQTVTVSLIPPSSDGLLLTINSPNLQPIENNAIKIPFGYWQGKIAESGMHLIVLQMVAGIKEANYNLEVVVNTPKATRTPTPTPSPTPTPTRTQPLVVSRVLEIAGDGATARGDVNANEIIEYSVSLSAGQTLSLAVEGNVQLTFYAPDGNLLWNTAGSSQQVFTTTDGTYKIAITTDKQELETFQLYLVVN